MTILPTHLSLAGIAFWSFLSHEEKSNFVKEKYFFWIVLTFSILPDIDIFFALHRGLSHSLIPPVLLVILGTCIHILSQYRITQGNNNSQNSHHLKNAFRGRLFLYAGLLWSFHLLLDLEYPLAIFYPLSDRLYQIDFAYLLSLLPWLFFPVMIVGVELQITSTSYLQGIANYFVNLTPSQRIEVFGSDVITIGIEDIFLHLVLLSVFLHITRPMFPKFSITSFKDFRSNLQYDRYVFTAGLVLILLGSVMGPVIGTHVVDSSTNNSSFRISSTSFASVVALSVDPSNYLFQSETIMKVSGSLKVEPQTGDFDHVLLISSQQNYNTFNRDLSTLFKDSPPNSSQNLATFRENYSLLLSQLYSTALAMNLSNLNETTIYTELVSSSIIVIGIMENWNDTMVLNGNEQRMTAQLSITVTTSRLSLFLLGFGFLGFGVITIYVSVKIKKQGINDSPQTS